MVTPTSVQMSKDSHFGDILIFATDGVYSSDQTAMGQMKDHTYWTQVEARLILLYRCLRGLFCSSEPLSQARLDDALAGYLQELKAENFLEDDATVCVLVTGAAQEYHARTHAAIGG